jgi:hypothetical protein
MVFQIFQRVACLHLEKHRVQLGGVPSQLSVNEGRHAQGENKGKNADLTDAKRDGELVFHGLSLSTAK